MRVLSIRSLFLAAAGLALVGCPATKPSSIVFLHSSDGEDHVEIAPGDQLTWQVPDPRMTFTVVFEGGSPCNKGEQTLTGTGTVTCTAAPPKRENNSPVKWHINGTTPCHFHCGNVITVPNKPSPTPIPDPITPKGSKE